MQPKVDVPDLNGLKIRWRLHGDETEPTTRQRGINVYRQLQEFGIDADAWDGKECADIIVLQYGMRMLDEALATGATVVTDINDQIFAKHHPHHQETIAGFPRVHAVVAGSPRLEEHLRRLHPFVRMIEDSVDNAYFTVEKQEHTGMNILWVGMHDNIMYFSEIDTVLSSLSNVHGFTVHFITSKKDGGSKSNRDKVKQKPYPAEFHEWSLQTVLEQASLCDFAVVPLFQNDWCWCKNCNKVAALSSCGLPVIASENPSYRAFINQGINGFLAYTEQDWKDAITMLLTNQKFRGNMEKAARQNAELHNAENTALQWVELFREIRPK